MEQWVGIVIFVAFIGFVLTLSLLVRYSLDKKRAKKKPQLFDRMRQAVAEAVPQVKGYPVVMAQAEKDTISLLKEGAKNAAKQVAVATVGALLGVRANLRTYGNNPPKFILAYRGSEIIAVCVGNPSFDDIKADPDCILFLTRQNVEKIKLGANGRTTFLLQDGAQFIISLPTAAASEIEQTAEVKAFKEFILTFAQVVNE